MSVYVDSITEYPIDLVALAARKYGTRWCHMTADTITELMAMARRLKLSPAYLQRGGLGKRVMHFDLVPSKREIALQYGAIEVATIEMIKLQNRQAQP